MKMDSGSERSEKMSGIHTQAGASLMHGEHGGREFGIRSAKGRSKRAVLILDRRCPPQDTPHSPMLDDARAGVDSLV